MSEVITLKIPKAAVDLISAHGIGGIQQSYKEFVESSRLPLTKLRTFAMLITPIVENETKTIVGHVSYWSNGVVTVSQVKGDNAILDVALDWGDSAPNLQECVEIWDRYSSWGEETAVSESA